MRSRLPGHNLQVWGLETPTAGGQVGEAEHPDPSSPSPAPCPKRRGIFSTAQAQPGTVPASSCALTPCAEVV